MSHLYLNCRAATVAVFTSSNTTAHSALAYYSRAGMLNIFAKTRATSFSNGRNVLSYISEVRELRGDRFLAIAPRELREETKNSVLSGLFHQVSDSLHHLPSQFTGFTPAGSFKTADRYGNLQLTFYIKGDDCVVEIDIDEASGSEHLFEVDRNRVAGTATHPYIIQQILIAYQKLDPGYRLR